MRTFKIENGETSWTTDDDLFESFYLSPPTLMSSISPLQSTAPASVDPQPTSTAPTAATAAPSAATADDWVLDDIVAHETGGVLSYLGALTVLRAACQSLTTGWMNAGLFSQLTEAADDLVNGSITATKYVQQMFENVVLGNSANAYWNGGDDQAIALGDLTATSRRWVFNDLLSKWFLGADMPGVALTPGAADNGTNYQSYSLPLFSSAGPQITDVSQGAVGDCWYLAALAETALLDPSEIENMFTQHGNGSYAVRFEVNGQPDFVTVNGELPTLAGNSEQSDGSRMAFANSTSSLWVPLLEKALAQLSEQTGVETGVQYAGGDDQYYELSAGDGEGISLVTGQSFAADYLGNENALTLAKLLGTLETSLVAGDDVLLGTSNDSIRSELVPNHMYAVTAINTATDMVTLFNPWGSNSFANHATESFSISANVLVLDHATFYAAYGAVKS